MSELPIYDIEAFQKGASSFYANDLRIHLQSHLFINTPHSHSTYIVVLFTKGTGLHHIDFETYQVTPWTVFLLKPGQVHAWELTNDVEGYIFFHTREFYNDMFYHEHIENYPFYYLSQNYPLVYIVENERSLLEQLFESLIEEIKMNQLHKIQYLCTLITQIYIRLSRVYEPRSIHHEGENLIRIRKLQKLIDENFVFKKNPSDYADMMYMSTRHLSRICKETLHRSTSDLIHERIILEAKRLLTHSHTPVSAVAYALGYEDASYFSRLFRNKTGHTPNQFKQQLRKEP